MEAVGLIILLVSLYQHASCSTVVSSCACVIKCIREKCANSTTLNFAVNVPAHVDSHLSPPVFAAAQIDPTPLGPPTLIGNDSIKTRDRSRCTGLLCSAETLVVVGILRRIET